MSRNRPQGTKSPERLVLRRVLINSRRFYIHTNLIKFVIAHFKLENRSMSCTFQLICIERFHSATDDPRAVDILTLDEEG